MEWQFINIIILTSISWIQLKWRGRPWFGRWGFPWRAFLSLNRYISIIRSLYRHWTPGRGPDVGFLWSLWNLSHFRQCFLLVQNWFWLNTFHIFVLRFLLTVCAFKFEFWCQIWLRSIFGRRRRLLWRWWPLELALSSFGKLGFSPIDSTSNGTFDASFA